MPLTSMLTTTRQPVPRSTVGKGDRPLSLTEFSLGDMLRCGTGLRRAVAGAGTFEESARRIVRFLYRAFRVGETPQCAMVRFYRTQRYDQLGPELQHFARSLLGPTPPPDGLRCLTLMASAGIRDEWNDRRRSAGHRAIPLPSPEVVDRAPMIAQLIRQMGLEIEQVVAPSPSLLAALEGKTYNVFHVERARGSPYIPAQADFVVRYGIESVLGFGGLAADELFAIILFSTVPIPPDVATRFRNIALDVKSVLIGYRGDRIFEPSPV
jgi:hypothetical protein